jgi:hypothetical protein
MRLLIERQRRRKIAPVLRRLSEPQDLNVIAWLRVRYRRRAAANNKTHAGKDPKKPGSAKASKKIHPSKRLQYRLDLWKRTLAPTGIPPFSPLQRR